MCDSENKNNDITNLDILATDWTPSLVTQSRLLAETILDSVFILSSLDQSQTGGQLYLSFPLLQNEEPIYEKWTRKQDVHKQPHQGDVLIKQFLIGRVWCTLSVVQFLFPLWEIFQEKYGTLTHQSYYKLFYLYTYV